MGPHFVALDDFTEIHPHPPPPHLLELKGCTTFPNVFFFNPQVVLFLNVLGDRGLSRYNMLRCSSLLLGANDNKVGVEKLLAQGDGAGSLSALRPRV